MTESDRPLPTPPRSAFGRQLRGEGENAGPLTADRLTQAAAEGRLEEFLQREIPEGEHARYLAMMMLGMSGLAPPPVGNGPPPDPPPASASAEPAPGEAPGAPEPSVPPEVLAATTQGDVAGLASLLRTEHARRVGEQASGGCTPEGGGSGPARAGIDQALIDELIRVAADNQVTVDWLLLRAVKFYLEEHRRTGRL